MSLDSRKTVIFGNGLGMALDSTSFSLDKALGRVWDDESILSEEQKQLICSCLPDNRVGRPQGEEELDKLQLALSACDFLLGIRGSRIHWLSDDGQQFPIAVRKLIYNTAKQFHQTTNRLPDSFLQPFCDFIRETQSHIGTLNYDNLLYRSMVNDKLLDGYRGALVDGFHGTGFRRENLQRKFGKTFGYYLHLHGSPLFVDRDGQTIKLHQFDVQKQTDTISSHIVLTHFRHKPTVISASHLLLSYWQLLLEAINESSEVILFGYSGSDDHLNAIVKSRSTKPVKVVEWSGAGAETERLSYWTDVLGREPELIQVVNILDFTAWD